MKLSLLNNIYNNQLKKYRSIYFLLKFVMLKQLHNQSTHRVEISHEIVPV